MQPLDHSFILDVKKEFGEDIFQDDSFCEEFYGTVTNSDWINAKTGEDFGCTFRGAGAVIAGLRNKGETYLDWYLCSCEGTYSSIIGERLRRLGWRWKAMM